MEFDPLGNLRGANGFVAGTNQRAQALDADGLFILQGDERHA
jgi:hypothetical protein